MRVHLSCALILSAAPAAAQLPPLQTGNMFVADFSNDRVAVYDGNGAFLRSFTGTGLNGPRGVVCAPNDRIYVASQLSSEVLVFDQNEQLVTRFADAQMQGPTGMALAPSGELYVSSFNNSRVCVFDLVGNLQRTISTGQLGSPNCPAFDSDGNLYVASVVGARLVKFDANGNFVASYRPPAPVRLSSPMGVARDRCDVLYVAGGASNNIVKFATDRTYLGEISHPDLTGPQGVAFDDRGHLFSTSFFQDNIVEFDANGSYVQTITAGGLNVPRSMAFVPMGDASISVYGCGVNPAGSITVQSGAPRIGTTVSIGLDNPVGTQTAGNTSAYLLGSLRSIANPCGVQVPGFGMSSFGASGELLIDMGFPFLVLQVQAAGWAGPGQPVTTAFPIPDNCDLVGWVLYAQGVLLDTTPGSVPIGLTGAVEIRIGG